MNVFGRHRDRPGPTRVRHRGRGWRRRHAQQVTGWLLGALVAASVVLGGTLWSGVLWSANPLLRQAGGWVPSASAGYQVSGTVHMGGQLAGLAVPARITLLYPGAQGDRVLSDPADPQFVALWGQVRALLLGIRRAQFAAGRHVGYKVAGLAVSQLSGSTPGVEVDFGPRLAWSHWVRLLGGSKRTPVPGDPPVTRVLLLPTAPSLTGKTRQASNAPVAYVLAGGAGVVVRVSSTAYQSLARRIAALRGQPDLSSYPVSPFEVQRSPFLLAPGVLAPTRFPWRPVTARAEALNPARLASVLFPNPLSVHFHAGSGETVYSNGRQWLLTVRAAQGAMSFFVPPGGGSLGAPAWYAGLDAAVHFVDARGGWPLSSWLLHSQALYDQRRCTLASCPRTGYTYAFTTRLAGLPVLTPAGAGGVLSVTVMGSGLNAAFYGRHVPIPGRPVPGYGKPISASRALRILGRRPPAPIIGRQVQVLDVFPAWVPLWQPRGRGVLEPVWAITLAPVSHAGVTHPLTALVDAYHADVIGFRPANGA